MLKMALDDDFWEVAMIGYNLLNPSAVRTILPLTKRKGIGMLCMFTVRSALSDPKMLKPDIRKMLTVGQVDSSLVKEEHTLDFLIRDGGAESIMEAAYRFCCHTYGIDVTLTGTSSSEHLLQNLKSISQQPLPDQVLKKLAQMFGNVDCVSGEQDFPWSDIIVSSSLKNGHP